MPEYTMLTGIAVVGASVIDMLVLRTRLITKASFWTTIGIMWSGQVFVDGWLTKLSSPIVIYDRREFSGVRVFFDSPIEDFGFAFALMLLSVAVWEQIGRIHTRASAARTREP